MFCVENVLVGKVHCCARLSLTLEKKIMGDAGNSKGVPGMSLKFFSSSFLISFFLGKLQEYNGWWVKEEKGYNDSCTWWENQCHGRGSVYCFLLQEGVGYLEKKKTGLPRQLAKENKHVRSLAGFFFVLFCVFYIFRWI